MKRVDGDFEIESTWGKALWVAWIPFIGILAFVYPLIGVPIGVAVYVIGMWWARLALKR